MLNHHAGRCGKGPQARARSLHQFWGPGLGPFSAPPEGLLSNFESTLIYGSFIFHLLAKFLKLLFSI